MKRCPSDARFPQAMMRVMMLKSGGLSSVEARQEFAARAEERLRHQEGSRKAVGSSSTSSVSKIILDRGEDYCAGGAEHSSGLLEAYAGRPEAIAEHIQLSRTMPCPRTASVLRSCHHLHDHARAPA